mmetsp:Transcript_12244/g.15153  ORF Transcript_12244/g.15153 Transcript_12244/m.15153 type:complete len:98 (-) Transcript_12244:67-360(-)
MRHVQLNLDAVLQTFCWASGMVDKAFYFFLLADHFAPFRWSFCDLVGMELRLFPTAGMYGNQANEEGWLFCTNCCTASGLKAESFVAKTHVVMCHKS